MKNRVFTAAMVILPVAVFLSLIWLLYRASAPLPPAGGMQTPPIAPTTATTNRSRSEAPAPDAAVTQSTATFAPGLGSSMPEELTNLAPAIVVENVRRAIRQYSRALGGNPVGTNPEIAAALAGSNPKHLNLLSADSGLRLNATGELIDSWGTPLFFHQLSATDMEIRSAGPDRVMWTGDDLVTR